VGFHTRETFTDVRFPAFEAGGERRSGFLDALNSFQTALTWPEALQRIQAVLKLALQRDGEFEREWPAVLGTLLET